MQAAPFNEADIPDAKAAFAEAFNAERLRTPFGEPDPFRAALTIWNEENGQLPRALWVAHAAKWHKDPDVIAFIEEEKEAVKEATQEEKLALVRDKKALKEHLLLKLIGTLDVTFEPKDVKDLANEIARYAGLHETPSDDDNTGKILGVIQHRLAPMNPEQFAEFAYKQQSELQGDLVELAASDVRVIN